MQYFLYRRGFISVSADEFSRGIRAATWALDPVFDIRTDATAVWLPLEKYLNGTLLLLWPDAFLVPRVSVFIASSLLTVVLFLLAYYLFHSLLAAGLSTIFIVFQPWYVWLSGTPMMEMYYFPLFFAGLLLFLVWLREERQGYWFWAGCSMLLASGFHVQSWTYINLVNLLTVPTAIIFLRRHAYGRLARLAAYYLLSNGFIISFTAVEYAVTGQIFAFLSTHTSFATWYYDGYSLPLLEKLLHYPRLVVQYNTLVLWIFLALALFFWRGADEKWWKILPLLLSISALLLNSIMNVFSSPATAAPGRFSLIHTIILSLYVGYGAAFLIKVGRAASPRRLMAAGGAVLLFTYGLGWAMDRTLDFPRSIPPDAVEVGRRLNLLLEQDPGRYMVELRYWEFLAVDLTSRHYGQIVFDREKGYRDPAPSLFLADTATIERWLRDQEVAYVLLRDEELQARARQLPYVALRQRVGNWAIYDVVFP